MIWACSQYLILNLILSNETKSTIYLTSPRLSIYPRESRAIHSKKTTEVKFVKSWENLKYLTWTSYAFLLQDMPFTRISYQRTTNTKRNRKLYFWKHFHVQTRPKLYSLLLSKRTCTLKSMLTLFTSKVQHVSQLLLIKKNLKNYLFIKNAKEYLHSRATSSSWFTWWTWGSLWRQENFWMNSETNWLL